MKKSNALMLSYMIFLVITVFVQMLSSWNGLDQIAMAATVAGFLFAITDYYGWKASFEYSIYTKYQSMTDSLMQYTKLNIDTVQNQNSELTKALTSLSPRKNEDSRIEQCIKNIENILAKNKERLEGYEESLKACDNLYSTVDAGLRDSKKHRTTEFIFEVLGFVCFFAILAFNYLVFVITPYQSIATVVTFALIMLNYYMKDEYQKRKEQETDELFEIVKKQEQTSIEINEESKKISRELQQKLEDLNVLLMERYESEQ